MAKKLKATLTSIRVLGLGFRLRELSKQLIDGLYVPWLKLMWS